jgi:hypothetical protein
MKIFVCRLGLCFTLGLLLAACETVPVVPSELIASQPQPPGEAEMAEEAAASAAALAKATKEHELTSALELYAQGQFLPATIALRPLINANDLSVDARLTAIKYSALSHCIQGKNLLCRQLFEQALRLDANFQLADTEASHPTWGHEFRRAQRNLRIANAPSRAVDTTRPQR